jgi:hypothetical protein
VEQTTQFKGSLILKKFLTLTVLFGSFYSVHAQSIDPIPLNNDQLKHFFYTSKFNRSYENESSVINCTIVSNCTASILRNNKEVLISYTFEGYYNSSLNKSFVTIISSYPDGTVLLPVTLEYNPERRLRSKRDRAGGSKSASIRANFKNSQYHILEHNRSVVANFTWSNAKSRYPQLQYAFYQEIIKDLQYFVGHYRPINLDSILSLVINSDGSAKCVNPWDCMQLARN